MVDEVISWGARPLLYVVRFLWWLVWDWFVYEILWFVGWPVCRLLSFGRFPQTGWREESGDACDAESLFVRLIGCLLLAGLLWGLWRLV